MNTFPKVGTNTTDTNSVEAKQGSSTLIIQLVNSKQTTRPFLHSLWKSNVSVPDFSPLIKLNPFQKQGSVTSSDSNTQRQYEPVEFYPSLSFLSDSDSSCDS